MLRNWAHSNDDEELSGGLLKQMQSLPKTETVLLMRSALIAQIARVFDLTPENLDLTRTTPQSWDGFDHGRADQKLDRCRAGSGFTHDHLHDWADDRGACFAIGFRTCSVRKVLVRAPVRKLLRQYGKKARSRAHGCIGQDQTPASGAIRLFAFPFVGGGVSVFNKWPSELGSYFDVVALQYPGRDNRIDEMPIEDMPMLIEEIARHISPQLDRAYAFYGHSMGGLVVYELARYLQTRYGETPLKLIIEWVAVSYPDRTIQRYPQGLGRQL